MNHVDCSNVSFTKYIRIKGDRHAKFVEFDFAINDPTLFVELVLPQQAFEDFCRINQVVEMTEQQQQLNDALEDKWRYGIEPTLVRQTRQSSDQDDQS
ncbi:phenol hydroxylase subunit [Acinetobacter ursingii]|uniref:phenol hydroxylase subunit n=1 Tax=Acinetobacter ursingii TaxID=108980 RepID=UPI003AF7EF98